MKETPPAPLRTPDAIRARRSVRHFLPDPVPDALLDELVSLTVKAPSSWNFQPWRIVVVRDAERRARLSEACFHQPQPREAPVSFVFAISHSGWRDNMEEVIDDAVERGAWAPEYVTMMRKVAVVGQEALGPRLREYNTKDALIAATHLSLAAQSLGLGSAFLNGYNESAVKELIGAADDGDIGVSLVMSVGYTSTPKANPGRLPLARTVFEEDLGHPWTRPDND